MQQHLDIRAMAQTALADHELRREGGYTWRMMKPKTWNYGFRVTWAPGAVIITGDLGEIVYRGMTDLWTSPWDAALFLKGSAYDYLTGKTGTGKLFDREATVRSLLLQAEDDRRWGGTTVWEALCRRYSDTFLTSYADLNPRLVTDQMRAAKALRNDTDLTAEQVYHLTSDGEQSVYSWPPATRWQYEALQLWASAMAASEPAWHRAWRAWRNGVRWLRGFKSCPVWFRPDLFKSSQEINGARFWVKGKSGSHYRAVGPFKLLGHDLSRFGLWRERGNSWSFAERDRYTVAPVASEKAVAHA